MSQNAFLNDLDPNIKGKVEQIILNKKRNGVTTNTVFKKISTVCFMMCVIGAIVISLRVDTQDSISTQKSSRNLLSNENPKNIDENLVSQNNERKQDELQTDNTVSDDETDMQQDFKDPNVNIKQNEDKSQNIDREPDKKSDKTQQPGAEDANSDMDLDPENKKKYYS